MDTVAEAKRRMCLVSIGTSFIHVIAMSMGRTRLFKYRVTVKSVCVFLKLDYVLLM